MNVECDIRNDADCERRKQKRTKNGEGRSD
jgi:hypothetical protein